METETRICAFCGDAFTPRRKDQRFCSKRDRDAEGKPKACRWLAWERDHPRVTKRARQKRGEKRTATHVSVRIPRELVAAVASERDCSQTEAARFLVEWAVPRYFGRL